MSDVESPSVPASEGQGTAPGNAANGAAGAATGTTTGTAAGAAAGATAGAPVVVAPRPAAGAKEPTVPGGAGVVKAPAPARDEGLGEQIVHEFVDQTYNPQNPLGPFKDPHSTMIAGIEEHVGYIPGWLLMLMILAVLLAMVMWIPTYY